ncbi:MAG: hypothetical protein R3A79_04735 [Nannocystaceae bacterium]
MRRASDAPTTPPCPDLDFIAAFTRAVTERPLLADLLELRRRRRADQREDRAA